MKTLIINSAKGGVGKSFITEGIAKWLSKSSKVAIIDLDTTTPNQDSIEGVKTIKPTSTNIKTKASLKKYIKEAYKNLDVDWVLIDTPPTVSDTYVVMYEVIKNAKILFVTTSSKNAIKDTGIGIRFFERRGLQGVGIVQNMLCKEFGEKFDSIEELGLPTIGTIRLGESNFEWVEELEKLDFENTEIKTQNIVLSKLTLEDLKKDENIPLKFYNLETWDYISEKLIKEDELTMVADGHNLKSRFDIGVEQIKEVLAEGTHTTIQLTTAHSIEKLPMPYEIHEAEIVFNNKVSRGLPMYLLKNGVYLWINEARIVSERDIKEILEDGGIDKGEGRIVPSLYFMLYMKRIFDREWDLDREYDLVKRYMEEIPEAEIDKDFLEAMYAVLEGCTKEEGVPDVDKFNDERFDTAIYPIEVNMKFEKIFQLTYEEVDKDDTLK
jgi:MinD superfamily P-loop ATPase